MFFYTSHSPCSNQCLHFIRALNAVPTLAFCRASEDVRGAENSIARNFVTWNTEQSTENQYCDLLVTEPTNILALKEAPVSSHSRYSEISEQEVQLRCGSAAYLLGTLL
jgi:hypothetical protein